MASDTNAFDSYDTVDISNFVESCDKSVLIGSRLLRCNSEHSYKRHHAQTLGAAGEDLIISWSISEH